MTDTAPKPAPDSILNDPKCSFCGKYKRKVRYLVQAKPSQASICNECVQRVDDVMRTAAVEERITQRTENLQSHIRDLENRIMLFSTKPEVEMTLLDAENKGSFELAKKLRRIAEEGRSGGTFGGTEEEKAAQAILKLRSEIEFLKRCAEDSVEDMEVLQGQVLGTSDENSRLRTKMYKLNDIFTVAKTGTREQLQKSLNDLEAWETLREKRFAEGLDSPSTPRYSATHFSGGSPSKDPSGKPDPERGAG